MRTRATSLPSAQRELLFAPRCACENLLRHFHNVGHNYGHRLAENDERVANRRKRLFRFLRRYPENTPGMEVENLAEENTPVAVKSHGCAAATLVRKESYSFVISPSVQTPSRRRKSGADNEFGKRSVAKITKCMFLEIPKFFEGKTFERPLVKLGPATYLPPSSRHRHSKSYYIPDKLDQSTAIWLKRVIDSQTSKQDTARFCFVISPPFVDGEMIEYKVKGKCEDRTFTIDVISHNVGEDIPSAQAKGDNIPNEDNTQSSSLHARGQPVLPTKLQRNKVSDPGNLLPVPFLQGPHWDILRLVKERPSPKPRKVLTEAQRCELEDPKETIRRWRGDAASELRKAKELRAQEKMATKNRAFEEWSRTCYSIEENMIRFAEGLRIRRAKEARQRKIDMANTTEEKKEVAGRAQGSATSNNYNGEEAQRVLPIMKPSGISIVPPFPAPPSPVNLGGG